MLAGLMLVLSNDAGGRTAGFPYKDRAGRDVFVVVLKLSFHVDAAGTVTELEEDASEVDLVDTVHPQAELGHASIARPSQLFDFKPGTDVVLLGHAHPPMHGDASEVNVRLRVGTIDKTVRAFGPRAWQRGGVRGIRPGPALPLHEPVPLVYERAWGGVDTTDPSRPAGEERNYLGTGMEAPLADLIGRPAAQLESPDSPIARSMSPTPSCFSPIHRHWKPRCEFVGTFDDHWMRTRMPLLPSDFDARHHVCVPHDQWSVTPLRSDEPFMITGATPEGLWRFALPRIEPGFATKGPRGLESHRTHLDTIVVDADARRVELSWRVSVWLPPKWERLEEVIITTKEVVARQT